MEAINISPSSSTPEVILNPSLGIFRLKGVSDSDNSVEFYKPIIEVLSDMNNETPLYVDICFRHFNTSSAKCLYDTFKQLKRKKQNGQKINIQWYYESEDTDMMEMGEDYKDLLNLPIALTACN